MGIVKIGILGAGIAGLTTALELKKNFPNAQLVIIADKFNEGTTSDGAAGIFRPSTNFEGPTPQITKKWIVDSYDYYSNLISEECGIKEISGYIFSSFDPNVVKNHLLEDVVPLYRRANQDELDHHHGGWKYGCYFRTLLIECRRFLPWALIRLGESGVAIEQSRLESLEDLCGRFDVTINCTGLGAKYLCRDDKLVPIRGQVVKVWAPWLEEFYYGDFDTYVIPGLGGVATLGGSRHYDSYRTEPCPYEEAAIRERCVHLVPKLSSAPVIRSWVGLRPHRQPVRLEIDPTLKLVHNYGHGGYGVTSAPGTAINAVELVRQLLSIKSRL